MSDRIEDAFRQINRADFVPDEVRGEALFDMPIPIGFGQTNSQPTTVQMMLEWLDPQPGDNALDVGSGSGWTTALLAYLVGPKGKVYAVERIPELVEFGRQNCANAGITNVQFFEAGKTFGLPQHAPYDRILVSASAQELPRELVSQLKPGGKMVVPVRDDVLEITKTTGDQVDIQEHSGFLFVPLY